MPSNETENNNTKKEYSDFIREVIKEDIKNNKNNGNVITRFPPEPNGYLHIGHAKAVHINFGIAKEFKGRCHLRFDDTNPLKEDIEYIEAIKNDIKWMGYDWNEHLYFASDYFESMHQFAIELIKKGKAYVDNLSAEEIREYRGTLTKPGKNSPNRERSIDENLDLFEKMHKGDFPDGAYVLRAKIDMSSPNLNMRDPVMYRIQHANHYRQKDKWCIYPMYDWAHGLEDSIEGITHSLCSLEFEDHRPLYDWFLDQLEVKCHPQQIEFARLNLTYTVMSKRKLLRLVEDKIANGWDDPRMPTISGLRRRGYTPGSIKDFCERIGVAKSNSTVDIAFLEHCLREDLNKRAMRIMVVLNPLKVVIENYPEDKVEEIIAENNPEDPGMGTRKIPFSREIYIEQDDFREDPPKKYFRLSPGKEIRLKHAYYIKCEKVIKDEKTGDIVELRCTYDPRSKGGWTDDGRIVKGTSHWVSASHAVKTEVRIYENLFIKENPEEIDEENGEKDFLSNINPDSLKVLNNCFAEPGVVNAKHFDNFQFLRQGYFCVDPDSTKDKIIFNRSVSLKDTWAKIEKKLKD